MIFQSQNLNYYHRSSLKVLKVKNTTIKTFNLVFKVVGTDFGTRSKV
jgi:hypothetical protein